MIKGENRQHQYIKSGEACSGEQWEWYYILQKNQRTAGEVYSS